MDNCVEFISKTGSISYRYPGSPLYLGCRGTDVSKIQYFLNSIRIAYYEQQLDRLAVDGIFGKNTHATVAKYQTLENLKSDGIVGPATWYSIVSKYLSIDTNINPPYPGTVLQIGSYGSDVSRMQEYLNAIGTAFYPQLAKLSVDGIFGQQTQMIVKEYQALEGLTVDGKIGPNTWDSIVTKYNSISGGGEQVWPGFDLTYGVTGDDVIYMQALLNIIQSIYTAINKLTIDGDFEGNTEAATRRFQEQFGLTADGVIGEKTWNSIVNVAQQLNNGIYTRVTTEYPGYYLEVGSSGDSVRFIESYLNRISTINQYGWPDLTIDGDFGPDVKEDVMAFQAVSKLSIDGIVGPSTWSALIVAFNATLA